MNIFQWFYLLGIVLIGQDFCVEGFTPKVTRTIAHNSFSIEAFDDSTTLLMLDDGKLKISNDNGEVWNSMSDLDVDVDWFSVDRFFSHDRAFAFSRNDTGFYMTENQGHSWKHIDFEVQDPRFDDISCDIISHPRNRNYLLADCSVYRAPSPDDGIYESSTTFHLASNDGGNNFKNLKASKDTEYKVNSTSYGSCHFGEVSTKSSLFNDNPCIYCLKIVLEKDETHDTRKMTSKFYYTEDFGKNFDEIEQFVDKTVSHIEVLNSYIIVSTVDDQFNRFSPAEIWISNDGKNFVKAYFPTNIRSIQSIYEDITGRIILPVRTSQEDNAKMASTLLISDSSGTKFSIMSWGSTNSAGMTMFGISDTLPGTMLAEFHPSGYMSSKKKRMTKTKITTDNGHTWNNLRVVDPDGKTEYSCDIEDYENCSLLGFYSGYSITEVTPGIFMMSGAVGSEKNVHGDDRMTFLSTDGGETWKMAFEYMTRFAYGDYGNIIIAMPFNPDEDDDPKAEFYYSMDHGKTWSEYQLEKPIYGIDVSSTTPDNSGLTFVINGMAPEESMDKLVNYIYAIDFSDAFDKKQCKEEDFEVWNISNGECVNGAKYRLRRRKAEATCLVRRVFEDLQVMEEPCEECTEADYECSFEFAKDENGKCIPDYELLALSGTCAKAKKGEIRISPMKKMKGNKCKNDLSIEPITINCKSSSDPNNSQDEITITENEFTSRLAFYEYFDTIEDESLIIVTEKDGIYISHDSGQNIKKFDSDDNIFEVVFNPFFNSSAYLFGSSGSLYITRDRGNSFYVTQLPEARQLGFPLEFNAKDADTFIFYGGEDCDSIFDSKCHAVAYITKDGGRTFKKLLDNAIHCEFVGSTFDYPIDDNLIVCQVKEKLSQQRSLVSSKDFFQNDKTTIFESIIGYMSTGDFLVVAVPYGDKELRAYVTVDGGQFAEANFPQKYLNSKQESFTVLGSQTGAIFVHVSTSDKSGGEYGVLMKSNSNGTSFVALETAVNRNEYGMVDFEKVEGLEGIILINTVSNAQSVSDDMETKKLKSKITFNDGADWTYLKPPLRDSEGKSYKCKKGISECSLHLHSYTERKDVRDTFSSGSAFGMLIGVGNVGEYLLPEEECSTFISIDGGKSWSEIRKEPLQWEYGDHGGVITLVSKGNPTNTVIYSINSGKTWEELKFTDEKTIVQDIITVPRDSALRFLLITETTSVKGKVTKTFSINFRGKFEGQCVFNPQDPDNDDFEYVSLTGTESQCLFGHQAEYLKKIRNDCFVGSVPLSEFYKITKNCSCTRQDFECDYNFYKASDGTCKLVEGLNPVDPSGVCKKDGNLVEFFKSSGYRKIPLSTCEGGLKLDTVSDPYPCPGMEKQFNEKYGIGGKSFLLIFFIPFVLIALIAWFVYDRGVRRNGGFSRFGEIRLNENELIEDNATDRVVNEIVKSGLFLVSGFVAAFQLMKRSVGNTFTRVSERLRGRRGPSYSSLVHDQFLDEADDLLAGHDEDANDLGDFMENEGNFEIEDDDTLSIPDQINSESRDSEEGENNDRPH